MYKITNKKMLAPNTFLMDIEAPRIAKSCLPGQFVIVRSDEKSERIPLTICDYNTNRGTVTVVFQALGISTRKISTYEVDESFLDFVGPLGHPSDLVNGDLEVLRNKSIVFVADGIGAAHVYPQVKWLYEQVIDADVIVGCESKEHLLLEKEMRTISANSYIATNDGSYGYKGSAEDLLKELIEKERKNYDYIVAVAPMTMMKSICEFTKGFGIKTIVSLKQIMIDGIGLCGGCRVTVGGETKFTCIDGPEFDGHLVDFEEAIRRQAMYKKEEAHKCRMGLGL